MSLKRFLRRSQWDDERAREIESHIEIETAENLARGLPPAEAAAAARRKFGNVVLVREEIYRMNSVNWLESAWQDLRYGARFLRKSPSFAFVAILSLALGIGANTAIFQLLDAVRLRALPVQKPQELAEVRIVGGNQGMGINTGRYVTVTQPIWRELKSHQQAFSGVFAWAQAGVRVGQGESKTSVSALLVSGDFFPVLGVQPWRGRLLTPEDDGPCPASKAVVSYSYWQNALGGRDLAGARLYVTDNGREEPKEIVGVTPPGFFGIAVGERFDVALAMCEPREPRRDVFNLAVMGRLRPGFTIERATAQLQAISPGIFEETLIAGYTPETEKRYRLFQLAAYPAAAGVSALRDAYDSSLWLLLAITGLVLLIACANLANLMLARASTRDREVAVRLALGASRFRLLRQSFVESGLLAVIGATLGVGLAQLVSRALIWSLSTESGSVQLDIQTDWRVLAFAACVSGLTCLVFGAAPALRGARTEPVVAMNAAGRGLTAGRERFSLQRLMVVAQIAVSLVLLVGALLFVRSFRNLLTFDPGMREEGIVIAFVGYDRLQLAPERYDGFRKELLADVRSVPGVDEAGTTTNVPLLGGSWGHGVTVGASEGGARFTWVDPGYFRTMGIPVLSGRGFDENDSDTGPKVALVNGAFIRQFVGGANPLGVTLRTHPEPGYPATVYEIVGVIPDTQYNDLRGATQSMVFAPASQFPAKGPFASIMVHTHLPATAVLSTIKARVQSAHPGIEVDTVEFQRLIRDRMAGERLLATLSGLFGLLAAVLATVGLYGVVSYIVARRRNEIGIRVALGARRSQILGMVMRDAATMLVVGVGIGTVLALLAGRSAGSMLFGLKPYDPLTLLAAAGLLALITVGASLVPARRATRLDPMVALRQE